MWKRPEIKENFTVKMTGRSASPNVIAALRRRRGAKASVETIEKLRKSHIGNVRSEASRKKQSQSVTGPKNHFFGKHHSEDFRLKRGRPVRCLDTDEVFPSLGRAIKSFGGSRSNLARSIKKGQMFSGKRWEYVAR